jgi:DNA transformation protein and related proteins
MVASKSLSELNGLGPKSQQMLANAGITTVARLKELGSIEAYFLTKEKNPGVSLNLLWGLESAISGESWQTVAREHRASLLLALEIRQKIV